MEKRCVKCSFKSEIMSTKFDLPFCEVCIQFVPNSPEEIQNYVDKKIDVDSIEPFRKYAREKGEPQKKSMIQKAKKGELMSRAPFGYKTEKKKLILAPHFQEVEEIFTEFLTSNISLRKLSKKHSFSVNGLKKILMNFTYIGKIKFNNEIYEGTHTPIISTTLFNHVQNKLERLKKNKTTLRQ